MMTMKYGVAYCFLLPFIFCAFFISCESNDLKHAQKKTTNPTENEHYPVDASRSAIKEEKGMLESESKTEKKEDGDDASDSALQEIDDTIESGADNENQKSSGLEEQDLWFVAGKEPSEQVCHYTEKTESKAMNIQSFLCDDPTNVEETEDAREARRVYVPRPLIQFINPETGRKETLLRPPTEQEYDRGGHFYLGAEKKDRFHYPNTVKEDKMMSNSKPCRCGQSLYNANFRVVGGKDVKPHAYPFLVSLENNTGHHFCGGMIICSSYILTAAHCLQGAMPDDFQVQIGDHDISTDTEDKKESPYQQTIKVHTIITNFKYKPKSRDYDIALVKLKEEIFFNKHTGSVCLPDPLEIKLDSKAARVIGWGVTSHGSTIMTRKPKEAEVKTMSKAKCLENSNYAKEKITDTMMCARGTLTDSCQGDSGGPLLWKRYTTTTTSIQIEEVSIGIVSWGKGCALKAYPGVYTDLTNPEILTWIYENTRSCSYCK